MEKKQRKESVDRNEKKRKREETKSKKSNKKRKVERSELFKPESFVTIKAEIISDEEMEETDSQDLLDLDNIGTEENFSQLEDDSCIILKKEKEEELEEEYGEETINAMLEMSKLPPKEEVIFTTLEPNHLFRNQRSFLKRTKQITIKDGKIFKSTQNDNVTMKKLQLIELIQKGGNINSEIIKNINDIL